MVLLWCIGLSGIVPQAGQHPPLCLAQKTFARKIDHRVMNRSESISDCDWTTATLRSGCACRPCQVQVTALCVALWFAMTSFRGFSVTF